MSIGLTCTVNWLVPTSEQERTVQSPSLIVVLDSVVFVAVFAQQKSVMGYSNLCFFKTELLTFVTVKDLNFSSIWTNFFERILQ